MAETTESPDDSELLEIQARYEAAKDHAQQWRRDARDAFAFYAGDQWSEEDRQKLMEQQRVPVTFNRTGILIDAVVGYEMNNRHETRYIPRTQGDAKVNELLTNAADFFRDNCDAEFEESDAFRDMLICGMGWTGDRLSDEKNPAYDLFRDRVDPLEMLWDPSARKPNLDDARYMFRKKWMDKAEARAILPEWDGQLVHADWLADDMDAEGDTANINPHLRYKQGVVESSAVRDVPVIEYQYVKHVTTHEVVNPMTGEAASLGEEEWDALDKETREMAENNTIPHAIKRVTEWHRCFLIGAEIVKWDQPYPNGFTYHCITGKRDRNKGTWFGIVKGLHDPQMWSNKWLSQIMHLINTSAKPGYDIEKGAVENQAKFEKDAAKPGALNVFVDGALQKQRVQRREAVGLPPDLSNLMQYANDAMSDVSGINQELLGMADREQAGILEYQRKQSAVTLLAPLFDSFRRYRKIAGRCWLYFMQNYMSDGRLIRISIDEGREQHMPFQPGPLPMDPNQEGDGGGGAMQQFFDPEVTEYDVVIDQGATSPNQKEATFAALQPLLPMMQERFTPAQMNLVLEYSPLPESFTEKLKQIQAEEAQQPPPPDPEMMKVEAMQAAKQAELEMKQQEGQMELQLEQQKLQLEQAKAQAQLEMERVKTEAQIQLEREKAAAQMQMKRQEMSVNIDMDRQRMSFDKERSEQDLQLKERTSQREMGLKSDMAKMDMAVAIKDNPDAFGNKDLAAALQEMAKAIVVTAQSNAESNKIVAEGIGQLGAELRDALTKPKMLMRGPDGRAMGVQ